MSLDTSIPNHCYNWQPPTPEQIAKYEENQAKRGIFAAKRFTRLLGELDNKKSMYYEEVMDDFVPAEIINLLWILVQERDQVEMSEHNLAIRRLLKNFGLTRIPDKNEYRSKEYFQRTFLRRVNGFWYKKKGKLFKDSGLDSGALEAFG